MRDIKTLEDKLEFYQTQNDRLGTKLNDHLNIVKQLEQQILMNNGSIYTLKELLETFKRDKPIMKQTKVQKGKDK